MVQAGGRRKELTATDHGGGTRQDQWKHDARPKLAPRLHDDGLQRRVREVDQEAPDDVGGLAL
jgi:hypothetical protein